MIKKLNKIEEKCISGGWVAPLARAVVSGVVSGVVRGCVDKNQKKKKNNNKEK